MLKETRSLLGFKLSAQFRSWTNAALNTVALRLGTNEPDISDCSAPAQESCLGLIHKLRSQKPVLMLGKAADTEKYEALKSVYMALKAAWDTTEDSTLLSVGDSYVCEQCVSRQTKIWDWDYMEALQRTEATRRVCVMSDSISWQWSLTSPALCKLESQERQWCP